MAIVQSTICRLTWLFSLLVILNLPTVELCAQEISDAEAVKSAQQGLSENKRFPWYDAEQDTLRDVEAIPAKSDDSQTREKGWQKRVRPDRTTPTAAAPVTGGTGGGLFDWEFSTFMQWLAIIVLSVALIVLATLLVRYFLKEELITLNTPEKINLELTEAESHQRVENLPFQVQAIQTDPLTEARRLYEAGNFQQAILYLYAYKLMQLDRHHFIQLTKGKTNRQYLREIRQHSHMQSLLERCMVAFEDVFFGHYNLPRERFELCWMALPEFHKMLEKGGVA